ncbi:MULTISPECIES: ABC transporter ATP-binding protein [Paenibacillus]|uniref:ABC transporter ATP-binding protein n=1 Tax=Paenibacillus illinoisensis TaxID=59845 RepID=A0A2W0C9D3_9BACL|nr:MULTISPECIES: ABC transporter ATP-binding protein [Paenibacillus]MBM6387680.1 ABC transporter ATP-binding protein [Paenibacillus sp.]MBY0220556.1 ABC transporter ATP-binding protein [Paenibacillus illinoisensis]PAD28396.1 ABC transporter ATP-binding protein [Paenibacillus sp. 7523-1]PYY28717.1 ABC transporter ATP-binding protein [Paenibacillus illinoisensis]WJH28762.1 ABC transporter ATP-binding protein [Paenibacillus sp. CC-CFT742]
MAEPQSDYVLSVQHLKKKIGRKWIIKDVTFEVKPGEIFGFLGPNGAGKTTTIRMLVDLIKPTEGNIKVCGYDVNRDPERALQYVGSIVENPEVYTYLTGWENLEHFARMQPGVDHARIQEVVDIVRLDQRIHDKVRTYSLGMRQRLGIAQALLGRPRLLILDEPTNGLDPKGIKELRVFIKQLASEGMAVFVSSHLLSEIQLLCDRVAIISAGRVLAVGGVDELIEDHSKFAIWHVSPLEEGRKMLLDAGIALVDRPAEVMDDTIIAGLGSNAVVAEMHEDRIAGLVNQMVQAGIQVEGVQRVQPTLEQLFLKMTEGESIE